MYAYSSSIVVLSVGTERCKQCFDIGSLLRCCHYFPMHGHPQSDKRDALISDPLSKSKILLVIKYRLGIAKDRKPQQC